MESKRTNNNAKRGGELTAAPIPAPSANGTSEDLEALVQRICANIPQLLTLPQPTKRCPYTSLSRTSMLELVGPCERNDFKPPVRAIYRLSHKHAVRGRWLIPAENLFRYLLGLAEESNEEYLKLAAERQQKREAE